MDDNEKQNKNQVLVSVVVPTKNSEKYLEKCLKSIKNQTFQNFEIIVVDNFSTDKTPEIAQKYTNLFFQKGPERSSQRNFGAKKANAKFLFFVDSDMELSPNLLEEVENKLTKNSNSLVVIPEFIPGRTLYSKAKNLEKRIYDNNDKIEAARAFDKNMFDKIGGFNEDMVAGEDWDLDRRLEKIGGKKIRTKNITYHNEEDLGFFKSIQKKIYYAKKLTGYKVGIQSEVNPIYRLLIFFAKPLLILKQPISFIYLILLRYTEFAIGFCVYKFGR